jgi:menaquinone-dependent protoporphyrinogen oxidase
MSSICIVYGTVDGQTRRICEHLRDLIEPRGHRVELVALEQAMGPATKQTQDQAPAPDLARFDKLLIGSSIRYGRHHPLLAAYVDAHLDLLHSRPSAFFSVNIVARKPTRDRADTNPYVRRFLAQTRWRPGLVDVFAGRLDYPRYGRLDRLMIRLIMRLTHGPTDPTAVTEFTDWARVAAFAEHVAQL